MPDEGGKDSTQPVTPEQKADGILEHVEEVEFISFQEYAYRARKIDGKMVVRELAWEDRQEGSPNDILDYNNPKFSYTEGAPRYVDLLKNTFGLPLSQRHFYDTLWHLFCVVGEKNGKTVVQGGGVIHEEGFPSSHRPTYSSFRIVGGNREGIEKFIDWLQENPNVALKYMLTRGVPEHDTQGNIKGTAIKYAKDPFNFPIRRLLLADLRTGNKVIKDFQGKS